MYCFNRTYDSFLSGDIYLGAAETKTMEFIISIINEIQNQHPDLCFHFEFRLLLR